jgi:hypothetical protein
VEANKIQNSNLVKVCLKTLLESTNIFVTKDTMSKALMKLRLYKDMNRQIQKNNSKLRMQLQFLEDEKQELQDQLVSHGELCMGIIHKFKSELQTKDKMLAQFHETKKMEKEKSPMKNNSSSAKGLQIITEVFHETNSSYSSSPHQDENVSLNELKEHTYGIGFKLVTKMGYDGKCLGINGQGMTNLMQVERRNYYEGLEYDQEGDGECSKTVEAREASNKEV